MPGIRRDGVLADRGFRLLWAGQAASALGSALVPVAFTFAVVDLTSSASTLGLVLTAGFVSRIALLLLGGVVADRLRRQRVMLGADILRALTQGLVAALLLAGVARVWELVVLFALYGAGEAFFGPASTRLVAEAAPPERLQQANAWMSASPSVAFAVGPALAGMLVAGIGPWIVFALDAGTFAVSATTLALLRLPAGRPAPATAGVVDDLRAGWSELRTRTWVWASIAYFSISNLALAPVYVLGPFVAERELGGPTAWGLIVTCGGVGSLLGDVIAMRVKPRRSLLPGYLLLAGWALLPALLARPFPVAALAPAAALGFGALSFSNALWLTAIQERIPRDALSRVSAYDWLGSRIFQPLGYALAGPAGAAIGVPATLLVGAAVHASASVAVALVPDVRRLRRREALTREIVIRR